MIARDLAIPLAIHPYSTTSRVVRWLTRRHGKISTMLKGALRPKSAFLGEYELFGTSEILFHTKRIQTLFAAKECALLHPRPAFRSDWRAMRTASHMTTLLDRATPEGAPQPEHFEFFEEMLDAAELHGARPQLLPWMELRFCDLHGHSPNLTNCVLCSAAGALLFCSAQGGVVCSACAKSQRLATLACPPETLRLLREWNETRLPEPIARAEIDERRLARANAITSAFTAHQFHINPRHRLAATQAA